MKLTNDIRDNIQKGMLNQMFPNEAILKAENELGKMWLEASSALQEQKKMNDEFPDYVTSTQEARILTENNEMLNIHLGFYVAEKREGGSSYTRTPTIIAKNYKQTDADFYGAIQAYIQLIKAREEFKANIHKILKSCNTSTQLMKLVPETAVFFSQEEPTALIDKQTLDSVNNILDAWRKANGTGKAV